MRGEEGGKKGGKEGGGEGRGKGEGERKDGGDVRCGSGPKFYARVG